jgi:hypothetical protein
MILPTKPPAWAIKISSLLQEIEKLTGEKMYPVRVQDIAMEISRQFFPDAPITQVQGQDFRGGFEGMMLRVPGTSNQWGIVYNTAIKSPGRINFTLAHELGHYLLHRTALENGRIECSRKDMFRWDSEYGKHESEANEFASYLLMPLNIFKQKMQREVITLHLLQSIADYFNVSLTAAILKWLQFTEKRALLVVGKEGFVDWVWHSKPLWDSFVRLTPKKEPIELPTQSLAVRKDAVMDTLAGVTHEPGVWPFKEEVQEMTLSAGTYDMTITLLLFPNKAPSQWERQEEEPELTDTFDRFQSQAVRTW